MKVSFLVTYYNQEQFVKQSIDSILAIDKPREWEILIGDDGSTDGTINVVNEYIKLYPDNIFLYVMPRDNEKEYDSVKRASENRINLLSNATGDIFCTLDGDDYFCDTTFLKEAIQIFVEQPKVSIVAFGYKTFSNETIEEKLLPGNCKGLIEKKEFLQKYYIPAGGCVHKIAWNKDRIEYIKSNGYFDDNDIVINSLNYGEMYIVNRAIYAYRQTGNSIYTSMEEIEQALLNVQGFDVDKNLIGKEYFDDLILRNYGFILTIYFNRKKIKEILGEERYIKYINGFKKIKDSIGLFMLNPIYISEKGENQFLYVINYIKKQKKKGYCKQKIKIYLDELRKKNKTKQIKVLLLAYTNRNFGDDMFVKTICSCFPNILFYLEAPSEYIDIMQKQKNLKIIKLTKIKLMIKKIDSLISKLIDSQDRFIRHLWLKKYKAIVFVIGGLFDEDDIYKESIERMGVFNYKKCLWQHSFYNDIPFYLLGCNMTRIKSKTYIATMREAFRGLNDICFRDIYSYKAFNNLNNTRYAPDIVFNYPVTKRKKEDSIVISVWGVLLKTDEIPQWKWAENLWGNYKKLICNIVNYYLKLGKTIKLLSLCENEGDFLACNIVKEACKNDNIQIINYDGNIDEIIYLFETAGFIVGTRFHSIIMALKTKTPIYPISYESKTLQLLKDIKYQGEYSEIENICDKDLDKVVKTFNENKIQDIEQTELKARQQFCLLKKHLEEQ